MIRFYVTLLILSGCLFDVVFSTDGEDVHMSKSGTDPLPDHYFPSPKQDPHIYLWALPYPDELTTADVSSDYSVINAFCGREIKFKVLPDPNNKMTIFYDEDDNPLSLQYISLIIREKNCDGDDGKEKEEEEFSLVLHCPRFKKTKKSRQLDIIDALYLIKYTIKSGPPERTTGSTHYKDFLHELTTAMTGAPPLMIPLPMIWLTTEYSEGHPFPDVSSDYPCLPPTMNILLSSNFVCKTLQGKTLYFDEPFLTYLKEFVTGGGRKMGVATVSPVIKSLLSRHFQEITLRPPKHLYA